MVLVCFVRLRSEHRLKCATRIIMNLLHELGSRIHMQRDRFRQSAYGDTRMGFGIGRGGTILGQLTSTIMCSPEASTNPETSNALATYEPLPATREGLCGISAPILLKSLGGETKVAINPPAIVDCPMAAALLRSAGLQAVCKISSPAVVWKMAQERT